MQGVGLSDDYLEINDKSSPVLGFPNDIVWIEFVRDYPFEEDIGLKACPRTYCK